MKQKQGRLLFHGSYVVVKDPTILRRTVNKSDFGDAFYLTEIEEQAARWAGIKAANEMVDEGVVNIYNLDYKRVMRDFKVKYFPYMDREWLDFIAKSRSGEDNDFDVIEGEVADDQVYRFVNDYLRGKMSYEEFYEKAKFKKKTHQIALKEDALSCLDYVGHYLVDLDGRRIR